MRGIEAAVLLLYCCVGSVAVGFFVAVSVSFPERRQRKPPNLSTTSIVYCFCPLCVASVLVLCVLHLCFRAPRYSELHANKNEKHGNVEHHGLPLLYLCECGAQLNTASKTGDLLDCDPSGFFAASRSCYVVSAML